MTNKIVNEAYFHNIEFVIKRELKKAKKSVKVCVAWISMHSYSAIFEELKAKGVDLRIVIDGGKGSGFYVGELPPDYFLPFTSRNSGFMHNKFCIIDDEILINGSFNWTDNATNRHHENIVITKYDYSLIKNFIQEFNDIVNYSIRYPYDRVRRFRNIQKICSEEGCASRVFKVGVIGREYGDHHERNMRIYEVCQKYQHFIEVNDFYTNFLNSRIEYDDYDIQDGYYSKDQMQYEIECEKTCDEIFRKEFGGENNINALLNPSMINPHEHLEYGEEPEYVLSVIWRDLFYRKVIPDEFYADDVVIDRIISDALYDGS